MSSEAGAAPIVLTVAGSDPSGGAGLQADLKTIQAHRAYGAAVPTLITVQHTRGVERVEVLPAELVEAQLEALLSDLHPRAAKTGALGSPEIMQVVGAVVRSSDYPWVIDPVWVPSHGRALSTGDLTEAYRTLLIPSATLVTPNADEAGRLAGCEVRNLEDARNAAAQIAALGARAVLVTGGHLQGDELGTDVLWVDGTVQELRPGRPLLGDFHGTGCALSSAIASRLALGEAISEAVVGAKAWLEGALEHALAVGEGARPVNHLWEFDRESRKH